VAATVLIVHNGRQSLPVVNDALSESDWHITSVSVRDLRAMLMREAPEAIVLCIEGAALNVTGDIVNVIKGHDDNLPLIVVAQSKILEDAVELMKAGAYDYLSLPLDKTKLRHAVANAIRLYSLTKRVFMLESQMGWKDGFDNIIGISQVMREVFNVIRMVAKSNASVLVLGESGTGKELVAKAIHHHSTRCNKIFLDINCGAIPRELLENEMFGHERGAYTSADRRYVGSFERASGGTIFLDEISEMEPSLQVKLLRFLQERSFMRVGGTEPISVDVRIVTATNRDLGHLVREGKFREDLYYRLNVVPICLPPLRDRKEDIPLLAKCFLEKMARKNEKIFLDFAPQAMEAFVAYDWPGNVRELENVIERIVVLNNDTRVKVLHLPPVVKDAVKKAPPYHLETASLDEQKVIPLELVEKYAIESALRLCLGNVSETARKLKIGQATLYRKIKQYGLHT